MYSLKMVVKPSPPPGMRDIHLDIPDKWICQWALVQGNNKDLKKELKMKRKKIKKLQVCSYFMDLRCTSSKKLSDMMSEFRYPQNIAVGWSRAGSTRAATSHTRAFGLRSSSPSPWFCSHEFFARNDLPRVSPYRCASHPFPCPQTPNAYLPSFIANDGVL